MEPNVHLFYSILVSTGAVTIFFAPFGLYFSCSCLKIVHFNLRILMFTLGILWCILPIGATLFYFILDAEENPPDLYKRLSYQIPKNIVAITGYAMRLTETAISFERLLATIYFETYERKRIFRIYPFLMIAAIIFIATSFSVLFNILHVPAGVIFVFLFTVETINFILLLFIHKWVDWPDFGTPSSGMGILRLLRVIRKESGQCLIEYVKAKKLARTEALEFATQYANYRKAAEAKAAEKEDVPEIPNPQPAPPLAAPKPPESK